MTQSIEVDAEQLAEIKRLAAKYGITIEECVRKLPSAQSSM